VIADPKLCLTHPKTRSAWRRWLERNHAKKDVVWLVYFKKHTGQPRVAYAAAVEEAICFGWIDSTVRRLDEDRYAQKFTPRRRGSRWNETNVARAEAMIAAGKMRPAGQSAFDFRVMQVRVEVSLEIPVDLERALKRVKGAWAGFKALAPSHRRTYLAWVADAKRPETRKRRMGQVAERAAAGKKPGML
jgi:uncharacterized protein YdeI (YjbR/CyaY-like superfamily)